MLIKDFQKKLNHSITANDESNGLMSSYFTNPPIVNNLEFFGNLYSPNTLIAGGTVTQLGDDSGNNRHFIQATVSKQPTYNAVDSVYGNRNSMTFAAASSQCLGRATGLPAMANVTMYLVTRGLAQVAGGQRLLDVSPLGSAGGLAIYNPPNSNTLEARFDSNSTPLISSRGLMNVTLANSNILVYAGNLSLGGALWTTYLNGIAIGTTTNAVAGAGVSSGTGASSIASVSGGGSSFCSMVLTDILIFSEKHSEADVLKMNAWLRYRNG